MSDEDVVQPHVLCQRCKSICDQSKLLRDVPAKYTHFNRKDAVSTVGSNEDQEESYQHGTLREIEATCLEGCFLCGFIYYSTVKWDYKLNEERIEAYMNSPERFRLTVRARESSRECYIENDGPVGVSIRVFMDGDERMPPATTYSPAQLAVSTKSSSSFELARRWLNHCKTSHELCAHGEMPSSNIVLKRDLVPFLPTRLIDVSGKNPRLVVTADMSPQLMCQDYIALSHCWGKKIFMRLLTSNLTDLVKGFKTADLPNTFRDALFITHKMGYKYIWIDSLCIIQDSKVDWKVEADRMAQVYGGADFTIAAVGSDGDAGCFRKRNPLLRRPGKLLEVDGTPIYAYDIISDANDQQNLPLKRRAWTVQELLISTRVIYYGSTGLLWECSTCTATEFRPEILSVPKMKYAEEYVKSVLWRTIRTKGCNLSTRPRLLDLWNKIVYNYTSCSLTYATDRVAALAGIARFIASSTGMEYIAGLWSELLPECLLWWPAQPELIPLQPSWSWLSCNVQIDTHPDFRDANVLDLKIQYSGRGRTSSITTPPNNVLGEVSEGELKVTGVLRKVYFPADDAPGLIYSNMVAVYTRPTRLKMHGPSHLGKHTYKPIVFPQAHFDLHFLLLRRMQYRTEHRPARGPQTTYETEIVEQGIVVVPRQNQDGWIMVGTFHDLTEADWWGESWQLLFPRVEEVREEDETTISLH